MIKKSKSLFADSAEELEAERQKHNKTIKNRNLANNRTLAANRQETIQLTIDKPSANGSAINSAVKHITTSKPTANSDSVPIEVDEFGFLKKKKGKRACEKIQIFIRDNPSTCEELATCMEKFGITSKQKYCFLKDLYFVLIPESLTKLLNIDMNAILRNAEIGLHFIQLQTEEIFASKYGLVQMIAASKEPISLKFQDYVFELLHKIETHGEIKIEDIETRQTFIEETKLIPTDTNLIEMQYQIQNTEKAYYALDADYGIVMDKLQMKTSLLEKAEIEIKDLMAQNNILRDIAEKLGKYVKTTKINTNDTNDSIKKLYENLESLDITFDTDITDKHEAHADAVIAKKRFKLVEKKTGTSQRDYIPIDHQVNIWSLMRSLYPTDLSEQQNYTWYILQNVKDVFKEVSKNVFKSIENDTFELPTGNVITASVQDIMLKDIIDQGRIWYDDISLTNREAKFLNAFFNCQKYLPEEYVQNFFA